MQLVQTILIIAFKATDQTAKDLDPDIINNPGERYYLNSQGLFPESRAEKK